MLMAMQPYQLAMPTYLATPCATLPMGKAV